MVLKTVNQAIQTISNLWRGTPEKWGASYFYPLQNGTWNDLNYLEAFNTIPELNAIINLKARAFSNGVLKVVNDKGEEQVNDPINKLLKTPNWFQAQKEFMRQTKLFHDIFGNEYMYMFFPVGFQPEDRTKALFTLPPNLICPEMDETQPYYTFTEQPKVKYLLNYEGQKIPLDPQTIIHLNDNRVTVEKINQKDILKGESKMKGLTAAINNMKMAYESRGIIIKYRGAQGILSPETKDGIGSTIPFEETEKEEIQRRNLAYGTLHGQHQLIITSVAAKFTSMTQNEPKKLGLFEECKLDFDKMLDSYGTPPEMFVRDAGATYENQKQAEKGMYVRTTIPEANEWVMALNARFFPDGKLKIIADYSHLPIFQEDLKIKAEAMNSMMTVLSKGLQDKVLTSEEYREELGKLGLGNGKPIPIVSGDANQQEVETRQAQATLRGSVGGVQGVLSIQASVVAGTTSRESAMSMLTIIFGFTDEQANQILGQVTESSQPSNQNTDETQE